MSFMVTSAIAVFAFNRPYALSRLLKNLDESAGLKVSNHPVFIFLDAARKPEEVQKTAAVRAVAENFCHPKKVIIARDHNLGLRASLRQGITEVLEQYPSVVVLEDDLVLGPHALEFFVSGLERFESDARVVSICGYALTGAGGGEMPTTALFLPMTHPWGWATWRDRWQAHAADFEVPLDQGILNSGSLKAAINLHGLRNYSQMLGLAERGIVNSWWIYWHYHAVRRHHVSLFPRNSQVINLGIDGNGTHATRWNIFKRFRPNRTISQEKEFLPDEVYVDYVALDEAIRSPEARYLRLIGALGAVRRLLAISLKRRGSRKPGT